MTEYITENGNEFTINAEYDGDTWNVSVRLDEIHGFGTSWFKSWAYKRAMKDLARQIDAAIEVEAMIPKGYSQEVKADVVALQWFPAYGDQPGHSYARISFDNGASVSYRFTEGVRFDGGLVYFDPSLDNMRGSEPILTEVDEVTYVDEWEEDYADEEPIDMSWVKPLMADLFPASEWGVNRGAELQDDLGL